MSKMNLNEMHEKFKAECKKNCKPEHTLHFGNMFQKREETLNTLLHVRL